MHELSYFLSEVTDRKIMKTYVLMVPPDPVVEEAVTLAQSRKVGALVVAEDGCPPA